MSLERAQKIIRKRDQLRIEQNLWTPLWRDAAALCSPQKKKAVDNSYAQLTVQIRPRFNPAVQSSVAMDSLNTLAGGLKTYLLPGGDEGWGGMWQPDPSRSDSPAVRDWLADCTERSIAPLERGGFFSAGHSMFSDLGVFGTTGFLIDDGDEENPLYCQAMMPTNFVFERDWTGQVTGVYITWSKAATVIVDQFKQPGDNVPEKIKADTKPEAGNQIYELIQAIYKRSAAEMGEYRENEPQGQGYASCWVSVDEPTLIRERGYYEMPFMAPRWDLWDGTGPSNYGTSPAMKALADIKGVNLLDMVIATRAELEINPRIKAGPSQTSPIDLSPGGITMTNNMADVEEFAPIKGSYPTGEDQITRIEGRIKRHFFTDLFEAITPIAQMRGKDITNYVAESIQREAASRITPAIGQIERDFFQAAMRRVFNLLARAGVFEDPPEEAGYRDAAGKWRFIPPRVVQANRWTRTMNARKSMAFSQAMGRALQIAQVDPTVFDYYKFPEITADLDRADGLPTEWKNTKEQVQKMQAQRAQAAQQQMVQQTAQQAIIKDPVGIAGLAGLGPEAAA